MSPLAIPPLAWAATVAVLLALIVADVLAVRRRTEPIGLRAAAGWSALYIGAAAGFALVLLAAYGGPAAATFTAAYVVEKSLSVDNLFVFVVVLRTFAVPRMQEQRVLLYGVIGALLLRAVLIAGGIVLLDLLSWLGYLFGAFLVLTGLRLAFAANHEPDVANNPVVRLVERVFPVSPSYLDGRLTVRLDGRLMITPMAVVMVALAVTNVVFAVDSIPAVFGVTRDGFLVFTSNAFALLGLRALYFLLAGAVRRLVYLNVGLSAILVFVGVKMLLEGVLTIPIWVSLLVITVLLATTVLASLLAPPRSPVPDPVPGERVGSLPPPR